MTIPRCRKMKLSLIDRFAAGRSLDCVALKPLIQVADDNDLAWGPHVFEAANEILKCDPRSRLD